VFDNQGMCGGYPGPSPRFSHVSRNTNLPELIRQRKPLPHVEGDPDEPDMKKLVDGEFATIDGVFLDKALKDGDLFQFFYNTAGGYGDPIERDPERVRKDLDQGAQSPRLAEAVYGVVSRHDPETRRHVVDAEATERRRAEIRSQRLARGVPVRDWLAGQRERVCSRVLIDPVKEMYDDVFRISPRWAGEFRAFWDLPEDFDFGTNALR
jgi:acetone carboxylase alpha subunit